MGALSLTVLTTVIFLIGRVEPVTETHVAENNSDLDTAELFLRPVIVKYGHDDKSKYTWKAGSGTWNGMTATQGWPMMVMVQMPPGWGWKLEGEKKGKKKKKKDKKKKKKKKKKSKKKKNKKKKKKEEEGGGWGWSRDWLEEGDPHRVIRIGGPAPGRDGLHDARLEEFPYEVPEFYPAYDY